jgi:hypothetical protein
VYKRQVLRYVAAANRRTEEDAGNYLRCLWMSDVGCLM